MYRNLSKKALLELLEQRDESLRLQAQHYESAHPDCTLAVACFIPILKNAAPIDFSLVSANQTFQRFIGLTSTQEITASYLETTFGGKWRTCLSNALQVQEAYSQQLCIKDSVESYEVSFKVSADQISMSFPIPAVDSISTKATLLANEERYKLIAQVTTDYMYEVEMGKGNIPLGIKWISGDFERVTGYTVEEVKSFPSGFAQIIHPEDSIKVTEKVQRDIKRIRSNRYTYRIRTKSGRMKQLEDKVQVVKKRGGIRILGAVRDITKEQRTAKALKTERERYSTLFQTSVRGILIVDMKKRRAIDSNPRVEELFGVDKKAIRTGNTTKFSPEFQPDGRRSEQILKELFKPHIERQEPIEFEWTFERPDGKQFVAEVAFRSIELNNKSLSVMFIDDITDKKRAEAERMLSEERFELLAENMDNAFALLDEASLLYTNKAIEKIWERPTDEMLVNMGTFLSTIHADDRYKVSKGLASIFIKDADVQYRILMPDDGIKWIWSKTFRITQVNGQRLVAVLSSEITQMKNNESALIKATNEALESARLKSAFIASMSHEIRTPMNGIIGFTEMLVDPDIPSDEKKQFPFIINNNCQRLLTVLNDILAISKIEAQEVQVRKGVVNINKLLRELHQLFLLNARQKNIKLILETQLSDEEQYMRTDENKVRQIITNLLSNATKFTDTGEVRLKCYVKQERLICLVEDTGIGIAYMQQDKVFNRFHQAEGVSPSKYGGTGLGLSISDGLTQLLEGYIIVSSMPDTGTTFCLNLPYESAHKTNINGAEIMPKTKIDLDQKTILVAEDERFNFMLLQKALTLANAKVIHAETGKEAIDCLQHHTDIDLVLMDMRMPEMDGMEAVRLIKANPDFQHIPIIAQTAFGMDEDRERILEAGCNAYIAKPIKRNDLYELLNRFLA